jgi:Domain of unknown function (DUF4157)
MSDAAFRSRATSPLQGDVPDVAEHYVPKTSSLFGGDRMEGVNSQREAASSQIQRSLKAWRKAKEDDETPQSYIPQSSGGKPLPTDVRKRMEPRLGADLSGVRMHDGGDAAQAANNLGARAFTVGDDVHFNKGEFNPGTREGDKLIAHELTHVVQGQKAGVQRKEKDEEKDAGGAEAKKDGGGEKEGAEVSDPAESAEVEADEKSEEVAGDIHDEKKDKDDKKKDDKKDKKETGLDAANDEDEKKKKGEDAAGPAGEEVKEAAPEKGAKLFRMIYLKKAKDKNFTPDPQAQKEIEVIKAWIEKEAAKVKTAWSAAAIPVGATLAKAGAAAGTLVAPGIGTAIGAAAGAVAGALVSILGISKKKHHIMEEKAKLLDNVDSLIMHPEVIHELYDYIVSLDPDYNTIAKKVDEATAELTKAEKKKAAYDKKKKERQDKKAGKAPPEESKLDKAGEKAHHAAEKVEGAEAGLEVGAAGAEAAGHAAEVLEHVAPVLEGAAHVASAGAAVLNTFVAAVDAKAWSDKSAKYKELKAKMDGGGK